MRIWITLFSALVMCCASQASPILTGVGLAGTDSTGAVSFSYWDSTASDTFAILVVAGGPAIGQPILPGVYNYSVTSTAGFSFPYYGVNLFFDGNTTNPGISAVYDVQNNTFAATGATTFSLTGPPPLPPTVSGANSLSYFDGAETITLTALHVTSDGGIIGSMDLTASAPEPTTVGLIGIGCLALILKARKNRSEL